MRYVWRVLIHSIALLIFLLQILKKNGSVEAIAETVSSRFNDNLDFEQKK